MPSKSIKEMNAMERKHFSLAARTFHAILMLSLILSIAALAFGFTLYSRAVRRQFTEKAQDLSTTIVSLAGKRVITDYCVQVRDIFEAAPEELKQNTDSQEYIQLFTQVEDTGYYELWRLLDRIRTANKVSSVYIGVPDEKQERFIFVVRSERDQLFRRPGQWISIEEQPASRHDPLQTMLPVFFTRQDDGSYVCTGNTLLRDKEGNPVGNIVVNISMNEVSRLTRQFLWQYFLILAAIAVIVAYIMVQHLKKTVVSPINALANAAGNYVQDRRNGNRSDRHFDRLNITTGDEIENLCLSMEDMEQELGEYEENLARVTAEKERYGAELNIASEIQEGMLPSIFPPFPGRSEFDIYASMHTAKEVGGDFYDFFLLDDDHLAIIMADVSGKGVPAALFMMATKILINNYSMLCGNSPAKVLEQVNHRICLNNRAEMFVTTWLGILEISTGKMKAANAGHEYPALQKAGGRFTLCKGKHGFVLGGLDGLRYTEYELDFEPGDALFLYTDGVTEAMNSDSQLFGSDRMLAALNREPEAHAQTILNNVKQEIDRFVGEAAQFDDITMLCLRYFGVKMKKLTVDAKIENLSKVLAFIDKELEAADCPMKTQMQIDVAVEELFVNIASYAYAPDTGVAVIGISIQDNTAEISFSDSGMPYNPLEKADPDITLSAEDRQIGGLGIFMVKNAMDDMQYAYVDGQNYLRIWKKLSR